MVRAPAKTCPNLSRLFENAEPALISEFLDLRTFERFQWLEAYRSGNPDGENVPNAGEMLQKEKKEQLKPLETEAAGIVTVASDRGQYALEGLASTKLRSDRLQILRTQRDELTRSLWCYVHEPNLFEATQNSLHQRLFRRYDKHYQTFMAEAVGVSGPDRETYSVDKLLADLAERLDRGAGYRVDRFDIPEDADEPASEMYMISHPDPPTSVRDLDDEGNTSRIYFRPPGEAVVVFTPSTGRVHVRAKTRVLRHAIAESFIENVLEQEPSSQPVDFQAYDLSRFFESFDLEQPIDDGAQILRAQVIRAEVSVKNLANRLALSTSISQDFSEVVESQPGLAKIFERAVAIRFVEIAVRYRRSGSMEEKTLDFTITDRNSSSLLSLDDPFEREMGHRLLRHWGILQEGQAPTKAEATAVLPSILALWDIGAEKVTGAWLVSRGVDAGLLVKLGFLAPIGWEDIDLVDDDDQHETDARIFASSENAALGPSEGQVAPGTSVETYRLYRVRDRWVEEHLREQIVGVLDAPYVEEIGSDLIALGTMEIDDRAVPVYLARALNNERVRAEVDTALRTRSNLGLGLVIQAGNSAGACLAGNVLTPAISHVPVGSSELALNAETLRTVFRRNRVLAMGGQSVALAKTGENSGTLYIPGKPSIDILGKNRLVVIQRLVDAYNAGPVPVATRDLQAGIEGQSLQNIFGSVLWKKLQSEYVRSPRTGAWEIAP